MADAGLQHFQFLNLRHLRRDFRQFLDELTQQIPLIHGVANLLPNPRMFQFDLFKRKCQLLRLLLQRQLRRMIALLAGKPRLQYLRLILVLFLLQGRFRVRFQFFQRSVALQLPLDGLRVIHRQTAIFGQRVQMLLDMQRLLAFIRFSLQLRRFRLFALRRPLDGD